VDSDIDVALETPYPIDGAVTAKRVGGPDPGLTLFKPLTRSHAVRKSGTASQIECPGSVESPGKSARFVFRIALSEAAALKLSVDLTASSTR
jgi:hypothetical protein